MSKPKLIERLKNKRPELSKADSEEVIKVFSECIEKALVEGKGLELRGFGTFCLRDRKSIRARNPKSGETIELPKRSIPYFRASKLLKQRVN